MRDPDDLHLLDRHYLLVSARPTRALNAGRATAESPTTRPAEPHPTRRDFRVQGSGDGERLRSVDGHLREPGRSAPHIARVPGRAHPLTRIRVEPIHPTRILCGSSARQLITPPEESSTLYETAAASPR